MFIRLNRSLSACLILLMISLAWFPVNVLHARSAEQVEIKKESDLVLSVRTSPTALYENHQLITDPDIVNAIKNPKWLQANEVPRFSDLYMNDQRPSAPELRLDLSGRLWDETQLKVLELPSKAIVKLNKAAEDLRQLHYGKLLDWQEADKIFSRKSIFVIKDIETGLTFRVQRRAGHDHADVQPVTKADTEVMKQIYNKGWTWDRKAIIAEKDGKQIAASMNGMPHGGDGIPENGFSGHFCVHFLNSSTHKSDAPDLPHQLMVYKAAGMLRNYFANSSPLQLGQSLIEALHHDDMEMVRMLTEGLSEEQSAALLLQKQNWSFIRRKDSRELPQAESLLSDVQLEAETVHATRGTRLLQLRSQFARTSPISPWEMKELNLS